MRILHDPISHFFLLGALLFFLYGLVAPGSWSVVENDRVVISKDFVETLVQQFEQRNGHSPTPKEAIGLIEEYIREEILFREGMKLGLNQGDSIVRRRIMQKMEFLFRGGSAVRDPTEEDLALYLESHAGSFEIPSRTSFSHIYFSREKRGEQALQDAHAVLDKLGKEGDGTISVSSLGDPFLLQYDFKYKSREDITEIFGSGFSEQIGSLQAGVWSGPVPSIFGFHLVRVTDHKPAELPMLSTLRNKVRRAWIVDQQEKAELETFNRLRNRYEIIVEGPYKDTSSVPQ